MHSGGKITGMESVTPAIEDYVDTMRHDVEMYKKAVNILWLRVQGKDIDPHTLEKYAQVSL